jgi:hypothetical protein
LGRAVGDLWTGISAGVGGVGLRKEKGGGKVVFLKFASVSKTPTKSIHCDKPT